MALSSRLMSTLDKPRLVSYESYRLKSLYHDGDLPRGCQPFLRDLGEDQTGRPRYDEARTPQQRLLLSGVIPAEKQQELIEVAQALD